MRRKLAAYHRHIQVVLISQEILQCLAVKYPRQVWASFGSWLRTVRPGISPSELVTAAARYEPLRLAGLRKTRSSQAPLNIAQKTR